MFKICVVAFIVILLSVEAASAQQNYFVTLSTARARPLAMGGAYSSIEDDIASASYNPATLSLYKFDKSFRTTFYLNPIAPATLFYEKLKNNQQNVPDQNQMLKISALLVKAFVVTTRFLDLAFVFNEQILDTTRLVGQKNFFQDCGLLTNNYHSFIARLKLADRVSLGTSASLFTRKVADKIERGWGVSYGILLKPSTRMNVGLAFVYYPTNMKNIRLPLERLSDQTMNIGISYRLTSSTTVSFDLRNLTEDDRNNVREAHFGFEQRAFSIFAIRGGYFQEKFTRRQTFSGGIGLVDSNLFFKTENRFDHSQFMLNYSFVYQKDHSRDSIWHVLSLLIRI